MKRIFLDNGKNSEKSKRLEEISVGDHIFFPNCRIENVIDVKPQFGELYTERITINPEKDNDIFPGMIKKMVYELIASGLIESNSVGRVYDCKKVRKKDWDIFMQGIKKVPDFVSEGYK
jgi:hypothetical protein